MPPSGKSHLFNRCARPSECMCVYMHMLRCKDAELLMPWALDGQRERIQAEREWGWVGGHHKDRQTATAAPVFTPS